MKFGIQLNEDFSNQWIQISTMGLEPRLFCSQCKKEKKRTEIGYIHFADRTSDGKTKEHKIFRICRDCQRKEWAKPIDKK
jgi:hypothetical protein